MKEAAYKIPIDRAGRVVIPKEIRKRYGIHAGSEFQIFESDNVIVLKPIETDPPMALKNGLLIATPESDETVESQLDIVNHVREERIKKLAGPF